MTDEQWEAGEPAAFEAVTGPLWENLARFARRLAGDVAGDDLAQEALLVLHRKRTAVPPESAAPFLYAVVRNLHRNMARNLGRGGANRPLPLDPDRDPAPSADPAPGAALRHDLDLALAALPPDLREIALLRFVGDRTVPEIACLTGIKEGTVKSRLFHATLKLRERLKGYPS